LTKSSGFTLIERLDHYLEYIERKVPYADVYFWTSSWSDAEEYNTELLIEKLTTLCCCPPKAGLTENRITLMISRAWYFDVVDVRNFVIIKTLERIFTKYQGKLVEYEINEVDDSAYVKVTFELDN
jgi:hypothetical protein